MKGERGGRVVGSVGWCFAEFPLEVTLVACGGRRMWQAGVEGACPSRSRLPMTSSSEDEAFYLAVQRSVVLVI